MTKDELLEALYEKRRIAAYCYDNAIATYDKLKFQQEVHAYNAAILLASELDEASGGPMELVAEEAECAHLFLDDQGVPRHDAEGATFSLVGRIQRAAVAPR